MAFGLAGGQTRTNVDIDPASEAAVELLQQGGLGNYTDDRVQSVLTTVEMANAQTDFTGLSPAAAVDQAKVVSLSSMLVEARLACAGDCDFNSATAINELVIAVNIALGASPVTACEAVDGNGDGQVTISELVAAVNIALNGCVIPPLKTTAATMF